MSREMSFFIYLLERFAAFRGETADVTLRLLKEHGLYDYAIDMYELYHVENLENAFVDLNNRLGRQTGGQRRRRIKPLTHPTRDMV